MFRDEEFKRKFGEFYESLEYKEDSSAVYYNILFVLRRLSFAMFAFFSSNQLWIQISFLFHSTIVVILFVGLYTPFKSKSQQRLELFNEACILMMIYHNMCFTDFLDDKERRYEVGYSAIGVTMLNILFNLSVMIGFSLKRAYLSIKKKLLL